MIKCDSVLFDLDGTLWDTTAALAEVWQAVIMDEPDARRTLTRQDMTGVMGMTSTELMRTLFPGLSDERGEELFEKLCIAEDDYLRKHGGILYDGLEETLRALSQKVPLAIISNCGPDYIPAFFDAHGLEKYFSDWECIGRTGLSKGENIRLVTERGGFKAPVYVGDTSMDQAAAQAAGVPFIFAAYGFGNAKDCPRVDGPSGLLELLEL